MEILKFPDPALFEVCKEVTVFGSELKILLDAMWETMVKANGVGLASNQCGLTFRMLTMIGPNDEKLYIVNPVIIGRSLVPANLREGCLSSPGIFLVLGERVSWVKVKYQDEIGKEQERVFHGIHSVCIQHECQHFLGESFMQSKSIPRAKRKELAKNWDLKLK